MVTFWEIAAHSVNHMFSFVFCLFVILVVSHFGFGGWIWVLQIASVPGLCVLLTFILEFLVVDPTKVEVTFDRTRLNI